MHQCQLTGLMGRSLVLAAAVLALAGCRCPVGSSRQVFGETAFMSIPSLGPSVSQDVLTVHLAVNDIYCKKTACECIHHVAYRAYEEVQTLLRERYRIELKLSYFPEIYELEAPLARLKFDGVICKPWEAYRVATGHAARLKRIADVLDPHDNQWVQGMFMVRAGSDIKTLAQLDGRKVVLGNPDAYEKYHLPLAMLQSEHIRPALIFQKASCLESTGELIDGRAEVAVVSDYVMTASCVVDIAKPEDFRIIARTPASPLTSVVVDLDRVSEKDAARLQAALLAISGKQAPATLLGGGFVKPAKWTPQPLPDLVKRK